MSSTDAISTGIDLVHIPAFVEQLKIPGSKFLDNFTAFELQDVNVSGSIIDVRYYESLAGKWAAKEAFIKAWSTLEIGIRPALAQNDVNYCEIEVKKDTFGRPFIHLSGQLSIHFAQKAKIALSISHDGDYATAVVIMTP
ncbi:holo-[acyl-carrier-protein] synthase [Actinomycetota bacterium]|nr:holo-[acyl-carrier-protein] synthase [Actinomycetota bacterium]